jgi:hypothetical protein
LGIFRLRADPNGGSRHDFALEGFVQFESTPYHWSGKPSELAIRAYAANNSSQNQTVSKGSSSRHPVSLHSTSTTDLLMLARVQITAPNLQQNRLTSIAAPGSVAEIADRVRTVLPVCRCSPTRRSGCLAHCKTRLPRLRPQIRALASRSFRHRCLMGSRPQHRSQDCVSGKLTVSRPPGPA